MYCQHCKSILQCILEYQSVTVIVDRPVIHIRQVISRVARLKFTKFLHDIAGSLPLLMRSSALRSLSAFWNAIVPVAVCFKIGCYGNIPCVVEKRR